MKILVVDDSMTIRKIIRAELVKGGYQVVEAEDGVVALRKIEEDSSPPDLITLDIDMPRLNGFETCRNLRENKQSRFLTNRGGIAPIIFVTANDTLNDRKRGFELGATDFITKPFPRGEILAAVNRILRPEKQLQDLTALIVDDSQMARALVASILERKGLKVIEAVDGKEAFDIMCQQTSQIDLLIVDLVMPKMNGDELCRKIRQELNLKDLPIIFLTGVSEQSMLLNIFKAGGTDYIVKPFVKEELLGRLNAHFERTQLNKRLKNTVGELRILNSMKDNLLSVCSHDIRTPLNGIIGLSDIMLEEPDVSPVNSRNLKDIKESGELLLGLINEILDISKIQSTKEEFEMETFSLTELAEDCFNSIKPLAAKKKQKIGFYNNSPEAFIVGNHIAMIRVTNNILSNAIKFTLPNGEITFTLESGPEQMISMIISDNGIGISKENIDKLFDRFTDISHAGTKGEKSSGLGMAIAKEIIEKHGGIIEVKSEEGKGTCVRLILPLEAK